MDTIFSPYVQNWGMIATFIGCVLSIISFIISIFVLLNTKANIDNLAHFDEVVLASGVIPRTPLIP